MWERSRKRGDAYREEKVETVEESKTKFHSHKSTCGYIFLVPPDGLLPQFQRICQLCDISDDEFLFPLLSKVTYKSLGMARDSILWVGAMIKSQKEGGPLVFIPETCYL